MLKFVQDRVLSKSYPVLFTLAVSSSAVQLCLTAYLIVAGSRTNQWRAASYHSLFVVSTLFLYLASDQLSCRLILFLFDAIWTILFPSTYVLCFTRGSLHLLANIFGSIFWIFAAAIVWVLSSLR
jgi:hypothetical protein